MATMDIGTSSIRASALASLSHLPLSYRYLSSALWDLCSVLLLLVLLRHAAAAAAASVAAGGWSCCSLWVLYSACLPRLITVAIQLCFFFFGALLFPCVGTATIWFAA